MKEKALLRAFFIKAAKDPRIGISHITLFAALCYLWSQVGFNNPLGICSREVMEVAKISSGTTYHRLIRQLHEYGYLVYEPSFYKKQKCRISLMGLIDDEGGFCDECKSINNGSRPRQVQK